MWLVYLFIKFAHLLTNTRIMSLIPVVYLSSGTAGTKTSLNFCIKFGLFSNMNGLEQVQHESSPNQTRVTPFNNPRHGEKKMFYVCYPFDKIRSAKISSLRCSY
ncbi:unnamed protein product [Ilex paraguariensis]|uniref:Secreted protein n=1 Tax=Ilex paraguariensis TaxID=185542 RepID=A0ABC8R6Q1_9AQUA